MKNVDQKRYQDAQDKTNREAVNVASLVKVESFNPQKMTVTVQPLSKFLESGSYKSQSQILDVPVAVTRGGGFIFRPWYKKGDIGLVVYLDHDIDKAIAGGSECEPNTERNHSTSDAVFVGGVVPGSASVGGLPDNAAAIATEDGAVYIAVTQSGIKIVGNVDITGDVNVTGGETVSNDVVASGISLTKHVHGGVTSGPSTTSGPQ